MALRPLTREESAANWAEARRYVRRYLWAALVAALALAWAFGYAAGAMAALRDCLPAQRNEQGVEK